MRIYLIRHGEPDYEHDALTMLGQVQAEAITQLPWTKNVNRIICSPLGRAVKTARPLASERNIPIEIKIWLREMDDLTVDSEMRSDLAIWNIPSERLLQMERNAMQENENNIFNTLCPLFYKRWSEMKQGIDAVFKEYGIVKEQEGWSIGNNNVKNIDIPFFCHFGIEMTIMAYLLDVSPFAIWRTAFMAPASVTCLLLEEQNTGKASFRIIQMGDTSYMQIHNIEISTSGLLYNKN